MSLINPSTLDILAAIYESLSLELEKLKIDFTSDDIRKIQINIIFRTINICVCYI